MGTPWAWTAIHWMIQETYVGIVVCDTWYDVQKLTKDLLFC